MEQGHKRAHGKESKREVTNQLLMQRGIRALTKHLATSWTNTAYVSLSEGVCVLGLEHAPGPVHRGLTIDQYRYGLTDESVSTRD